MLNALLKSIWVLLFYGSTFFVAIGLAYFHPSLLEWNYGGVDLRNAITNVTGVLAMVGILLMANKYKSKGNAGIAYNIVVNIVIAVASLYFLFAQPAGFEALGLWFAWIPIYHFLEVVLGFIVALLVARRDFGVAGVGGGAPVG